MVRATVLRHTRCVLVRALVGLACVLAPAGAGATCGPGPAIDLVVDTRTGAARKATGTATYRDASLACAVEPGPMRIRATSPRLLVEEQVSNRWQPLASLPGVGGDAFAAAFVAGALVIATIDGKTTTVHGFDVATAKLLWTVPSAIGISTGWWRGCHDLGTDRIGFETETGLRVVDVATGRDAMPPLAVATPATGLSIVPLAHASGWIVRSASEAVRIDDTGRVMWRRAIAPHAGPIAIVGDKAMMVTATNHGFALSTLALSTGRPATIPLRLPETIPSLTGPTAIVAVSTSTAMIQLHAVVCVTP